MSLLAFMVALYALTARERRTPLIVNSVYNAFYIVFLSLILSLIASAISTTITEESTVKVYVAKAMHLSSVGILTFGFAIIVERVWSVHNQHKNFRTDAKWRNMAVVRLARGFTKRLKAAKPTYTHDPVEFSGDLLAALEATTILPDEQTTAAILRARLDSSSAHSISAAFRVSSFAKADEIAGELAVIFLRHDANVQYASCARHPIEFWQHLKGVWSAQTGTEQWKEVRQRIVLVDAFSPHFGFTDSIHNHMSEKLRQDGAEIVVSDPSYAGLHTATMKAFKATKRRTGGENGVRLPTLVIYEGANSLAELESTEQYRVFMRHMLPSERLWGGMFTLVVESAISPETMSIVRSYADIYVDAQAPENAATPTDVR